METNEALSAAEPSAPEAQQFDLGQWLGRHQAMAVIASYSSAADAHALRTIRDQKLYRSLGLTWEEFCPRHAGMGKRTADRIIENLQEFGDSYFNLRDILKIPAEEYRSLQPAIEDNTLEFEGRRLPINHENTQKLIEAVQTLRGRLEKAQEKASPLMDFQNHLDRTIGRIAGVVRRAEEKDCGLLIIMIEDHVNRAIELAQTLCATRDDAEAA